MHQRFGDNGGDPRLVRLRERLEAIRARSEKSTSWGSPGRYLSRLVNRDGYVPVNTRMSREDIVFLSGAREEVIAFTDLLLRLVELHQPRDACGISSDPAHLTQRCRACMWRWPCPTLRIIDESVGH